MKTKIKIIAMLLVAGTLAMTSCNKDDETEPLSQEEAKKVLTATSSDMQSIMLEVMTTPEGGALMNFIALNNFDLNLKQQAVPFIDILSNPSEIDVKTLVKNLIPQIEKNTKNNTSQIGETWTWNFTTGKWDYEETAVNKIIWYFPSNQEQMVSQKNDAVLTISDLEIIEQGVNMFPVSASISLTVKGVEGMSGNYLATLSDEGIDKLEANLTLAQYEFSAGLVATTTGNSVKAVFSHSIKKDNVSVSSSNIEVMIDGTTAINPFTVQNAEEELMPSSVKGYLQMGEVKAEIDYATALFFAATKDKETDQTIMVAAANEHLNMTFKTFPKGDKIGTLAWKWDMVEQIFIPLFEYNDGTTETLENAFNFAL